MLLHLIMKVSQHIKRCVCVADSSDAPSVAQFMAIAVQQVVLNDLVNSCVPFMLINSRPMLMYEQLYRLLLFLRSPSLQARMWSARSGLRIVESIHAVMKIKLAAAVLAGRVAASSTDECTTDVGEARLAVHLYFCKDWALQRVLAGLPVLAKRPNAENVAELWLKTIINFLGITKSQLASGMVMLAADGASAQQGEFKVSSLELSNASLTQQHFLLRRCIVLRELSCLQSQSIKIRSFKRPKPWSPPPTTTSTDPMCAAWRCSSVMASVGLHRTKPKLLPKRDGDTRWISHYYPAEVMLELQPSVMRYTSHHIDTNELSDLGLRVTYIDLRGWLALAAFFPMLYQEQLLIKMLQLDDLCVLVSPMLHVLFCSLPSSACRT
jgi:hypothetical protein